MPAASTTKVVKMETDEQIENATEDIDDNNSIKDSAKTEVNSTDATASATIDNLDSLGDGPYPFDDPLQRTRCLMQYIRLRNQRAEAEQAKRNALKKQKMDAQATLQNARDELAQASAEKQHWERKYVELNQERHQVLGSLKAIHQRETERKRQREAERQRRQFEEQQQRLAAVAAAAASQQQQQQSVATLDAYLQQALNPWFNTSSSNNGTVPNASAVAELLSALPPSTAQMLLSSMMNNTSAVTGSSSSGTASSSAIQSNSSGAASSSLLSALVAATQTQQQQQGQRAVSVISAQQYGNQTSYGPLTQQQQVQNAVATLLRQQFPGNNAAQLPTPSSSTTPSQFQHHQQQQQSVSTTASLPQANFSSTAAIYLQQQQQLEQLQSQLAAAAQQQQLPNTLGIQTALASLAATSGVGGVLPSPNSATIPQPATAGSSAVMANLSPELIYQAAMLAAAGMSINPSAITLPSGTVSGLSAAAQQQQRRK